MQYSVCGSVEKNLIPLMAAEQDHYTVIGTLAVDGWAVTISTARRGLDGLRPRPVHSSLYQM